MFVRCVVWFKDKHLPIWRVIDCKPDAPIRLDKLEWLVDACDSSQLRPVEMYLVTDDMWSYRELETDTVTPNARERTLLFRVLGVEHCPLFGLELELVHRQVGFPPAPLNVPVLDNRTDLALRHVKILIWTRSQNEAPPRAHLVSFNDDNTLQLVVHTPLDADLLWNRVNMWLAEDAEWQMISVAESFWLEAEYNTVLLRIPGTIHALGLGREIHALECVDERPESFGEDPLLATDEMSNMLVHEVSPQYDIATTSRASRAILRHAAQHSAAMRREMCLGKRQRGTDDTAGRRLRRRLSSA
ncbi:hypothetical protein K466DRAFT_601377 [Polyporus arcularius HHB13444]|uniref:Uncharacterized protein n=1 Tax=Polyporus arcularius HHB13444 TaxID=1314778 RepID=A0A5C3PAG6_9APHY|nr:hypothetical protein K466DRAFT_601377 [Polyporus arcularius HHB13444]